MPRSRNRLPGSYPRKTAGILASAATSVFAIGLMLSPDSSADIASAQSVGACGLVNTAFCDTFDQPSPNGAGTRSGDLDGVVWGVSRTNQDNNPGAGHLDNWTASGQSICGGSTPVAPPHDVRICNGQLVETLDDGENAAVLGMYPRQPFDIAGRTGTVTFDVNNDTQGPHAAWPAFVYTDQPIPAPHGEVIPGIDNYARNSVGVSFSVPNCGGDIGSTGVSEIWTTTNYQFAQISDTSTGCVKKPTQPGQLNRFQIRMSPSHIEVWGSDAGSTALRLIDTADVQMPLTRGLIWMEDVHYAGNKFNTQGDHVFVWDNVGFDGPVLPRDLGFDVLDANSGSNATGSLGWLIGITGKTFQIPNVHGVDNATAALLEFTWVPYDLAIVIYSFNGHTPHIQPFVYPNGAAFFSSQTLAVEVPVSELVNGTNTLTIVSSTGLFGGSIFANLDLILAGAGGTVGVSGGGGGPPPNTATPTPAPATATPTLAVATATPTLETPPTATPTSVPPTVVVNVATATATPTAAATATAPPTQVPTSTPMAPPTSTPGSFAAGFSSTAQSAPTTGDLTQNITANVQSSGAGSALVDLEVYDARWHKVYQRFWDNQAFTAGHMLTYTTAWTAPGAGLYHVVVGVFKSGWGIVYNWNPTATSFTVD
jgi:hypothetical protein